jgi:hypothetical protein
VVVEQDPQLVVAQLLYPEQPIPAAVAVDPMLYHQDLVVRVL